MDDSAFSNEYLGTLNDVTNIIQNPENEDVLEMAAPKFEFKTIQRKLLRWKFNTTYFTLYLTENNDKDVAINVKKYLDKFSDYILASYDNKESLSTDKFSIFNVSNDAIKREEIRILHNLFKIRLIKHPLNFVDPSPTNTEGNFIFQRLLSIRSG